jgi:hypothetical protein
LLKLKESSETDFQPQRFNIDIGGATPVAVLKLKHG